MKTYPTVEKAGAYLHVQLTHTGPAGAPQTSAPFITLSRQAGIGGTGFARQLAALLEQSEGHPWSVYSANLIDEMLRGSDLPPSIARFLPEDKVSEVDASVGEIVGLHPNLWELVARTNELIRRIARGGRAILVGRGANFATADLANGLGVRLVAPEAIRASWTAHRLGIDLSEALALNARRGSARRRYVRATFNADVDDPTAYDLTINLARLTRDDAIAQVVRLVLSRENCTSASTPTMVTPAAN